MMMIAGRGSTVKMATKMANVSGDDIKLFVYICFYITPSRFATSTQNSLAIYKFRIHFGVASKSLLNNWSRRWTPHTDSTRGLRYICVSIRFKNIYMVAQSAARRKHYSLCICTNCAFGTRVRAMLIRRDYLCVYIWWCRIGSNAMLGYWCKTQPSRTPRGVWPLETACDDSSSSSWRLCVCINSCVIHTPRG